MHQFYRHIESYGHKGKIGVLVEFAMGNDFTPYTDEFIAFAKDIALHVAASSPVSVEDLLQQVFVKNNDSTVGQLLIETSNALHDQISIVRFVRWQAELTRPEQPEPPRSPANVVGLKSQA
jgi:translation elongation factor EF-Ts